MSNFDLQSYEDSLTQAFTEVFEATGWTGVFDAKLGNGQGVVIVPPGESKFPGALYVYKTLQAGRKDVFQVANTNASIPYSDAAAEVDVKVGYPPGTTQHLHIMSVDLKGLYLTKGALPSQVQAAIAEHLSPERWEPLRISPSATGLGLNLTGGWIQVSDTLVYIPSQVGILDLIGHVPSTANQARYVLVYYDPTTQLFGAVDGDDFENAIQPEPESLMPTTVPAGAMVLGHVRLHEGQTTWEGTEIVRASLPFFTPPGIVPARMGGTGLNPTGQGVVYYNLGDTYLTPIHGQQPVPPTATDDVTDGWLVWSWWLTATSAWVCTDNTAGAAVWVEVGGGGGGSMNDFTVAADSGANQTIADGNTLSLLGGTGIDTVASATDTVTIVLENTAVTPGSYTYASFTVDQQGRLTAASTGVTPMTAFFLGGDSGGTQTISNGNTLNVAGGTGLSSVVTATDTVTVSIDANGVTNTELNDMAALTVKARSVNSAGDPSDLAFTADGQFLVRRSSALTVDTLQAADIPNLAASKITSGQLALARGGTNADLSATGGSNQFLKQSSSGAAITVAAIASADIATALTTPGAIGGTTPAAGTFTALAATTSSTLEAATGGVSEAIYNHGTTTVEAIGIYRSRGSKASPTIVSAGDVLAQITGYGYDGGAYRAAGRIQIVTPSSLAPGSSDMPGQIEFYTTPDGSTTPALVAYLDAAGGFYNNNIILNTASVAVRPISFMTNGSFRWRLRVDSTAEGGSNAGSYFKIGAWDDSNNFLRDMITMTRDTFLITLNGGIAHTGTTFGAFSATPTTKPTVNGSRGANEALFNLLAALATLGWITNSTTA